MRTARPCRFIVGKTSKAWDSQRQGMPNTTCAAGSRFWDRITHPAQIIQSLPAALNTMLDPADCGPAFIGLPQDVQGWSYDYPVSFFDKRVHRIRRQAPDMEEIVDALSLLMTAERPMIIAGGGVQYSGAVAELHAFADATGIPVVETIAGRANMEHGHPLNCGPIGVTGSDSANAIAEKADVILAVGTRLQDFTTGSWTAFAHDAKIIGINVGRHDAAKHMSRTVVGDAAICLEAENTSVIVMNVDAYDGWTTEGHAWWEVGTPHVTKSDKVRDAHLDWESTRHKQRKGV